MATRRFLFFLLLLTCWLPLTAHGGEITGITARAERWKYWGTPQMLVDGDPATAWVAGGKDPGQGRWLSFRLPGTQQVGMLVIANGNQGERLFSQFRAVTDATIVFEDGTHHDIILKPEPGEQRVVFPPVVTDTFSIRIRGVHPGVDDPAMGDAKVAVSEVRVFNSHDDLEASAPEPESPPALPLLFSALKPGIIYLKALVPVPGRPLEPGDVSLYLPRELAQRIHDYYADLARASGDVLSGFTPDIREREAGALNQFREFLVNTGRLESFQSAEVNIAGLSMDRPIVRGDSAVVRVNGILRCVLDGTAYDVPVKTAFSFAKVGKAWLINGVLAE